MTIATLKNQSNNDLFCALFYRSDWVRLLQPLSDFGYGEALLLCRVSASEWIAWIPDFGETVLEESQFLYYCS